MSKERLFQSLNFIDDEYIKEAEPKMKKSGRKRTWVKAAAIIIGLCIGLYLFVPYNVQVADLSAYADSEYYPLIEKIEDYRYVPPRYKNNFESLIAAITSITSIGMLGGAKDDAASPEMGMDSTNGSYVETTDNQVSGVIEADIFKRTDKYIFRIGQNGNDILIKVYSIAKEDSEEVASYAIPSFSDQRHRDLRKYELYLSSDGGTVTVINEYTTHSGKSKVGLISVDVSDVNNMKTKSTVSIDGSYNTSRMVDGKIILISEFYFAANNADYANPETYVPTIDRGNGAECIRFENILAPETIGNTRYSVVALLGADGLELLDAHALLSFTDTVYVSEKNIYVTRAYSKKQIREDNESYITRTMSDIAVLNYEENELKDGNLITVEGSIKNQYSLDELDGHLRVVTSTRRSVVIKSSTDGRAYESNLASEYKGMKRSSATLSVINIATGELVAEVADFAPAGESAESVRFDGSTAYVCTAEIITLKDPVYYFDLSDYDNITYTDTGVIEGYSTSLINLGEGFLLGIGQENWQYNKVEVYEETDGAVVSVDKYMFEGSYSLDYKAYLVDRENNLFGFAIEGVYDKSMGKYGNTDYVLLCFNGYEIVEIARVDMGSSLADRIRALYIDEYLYVISDTELSVIKIQ